MKKETTFWKWESHFPLVIIFIVMLVGFFTILLNKNLAEGRIMLLPLTAMGMAMPIHIIFSDYRKHQRKRKTFHSSHQNGENRSSQDLNEDE